MSELEADKYAVKIWAHNFEKQKVRAGRNRKGKIDIYFAKM